MNTHARNPRYKLTMISIWFRGQRSTVFRMLPVDEDGKVRLENQNDLFKATGIYVPRGCTFSIGA